MAGVEQLQAALPILPRCNSTAQRPARSRRGLACCAALQELLPLKTLCSGPARCLLSCRSSMWVVAQSLIQHLHL